MLNLRRRQGSSTRSASKLPREMREQLHQPALGAVPLDEDGSAWAAATADALVVLSGRSRPEHYAWDEVERGTWDAEERAFTLRWTQQDRDDLVLKVPAGVRDGDTYASTDVAPFAKALRQRVEAAIVHSAVAALPSGATATASVRRGADGHLYSVTRPTMTQVSDKEDAEALQALENRVREGVGLPTQ
ncbi:hypothetical protein BKH36_07435 [Actinomyces naeslundii]|uniref:hypothetical protein n=1 Tax=Actinomyces naeslundii TaxID=1655 RepID=UPI00096D163B|nr:hypothetical protein [Actinomyces naeslundii]OMG26448.1 hypothetical protein BKH36_07435 [Actinomyces naeslundii]